jgi:ferredoxin
MNRTPIVGISALAGSGKDTVANRLCSVHGFETVALADEMKRFCRTVFNFSFDQMWGPSEYRNAVDRRYHVGDEGRGWVCGTCLMSCPLRAGEGFANTEERRCEACGESGAHRMLTSIPKFLTPRHALQQLGTEWGRACYQNVWVEHTLRIAKTLLEDATAMYSKEGGLEKTNTLVPRNGIVISDVRFQNEFDAIHKAGGYVIRLRRPGAGLAGAAGLHISEQEQANIPDEAFDHVIENDGTLDELLEKVGRFARVIQSPVS